MFHLPREPAALGCRPDAGPEAGARAHRHSAESTTPPAAGNPIAALADLVGPASAYLPGAQSAARVLPVAPALSRLLPGGGLRRGSTVAVSASASLIMALLAEASRSGSWCAVVGIPTFGAVAASELGIALERLALVPRPGPDWPAVVAALVDGVDVVVAAIPPATSPALTRRLAARARQRGCVLVPYGDWAGADVTLRLTDGAWQGLSQGRGRLRRRRVAVAARGRGGAARPRSLTLWLPTASGGLAPAAPPDARDATGPGARPGLRALA